MIWGYLYFWIHPDGNRGLWGHSWMAPFFAPFFSHQKKGEKNHLFVRSLSVDTPPASREILSPWNFQRCHTWTFPSFLGNFPAVKVGDGHFFFKSSLKTSLSERDLITKKPWNIFTAGSPKNPPCSESEKSIGSPSTSMTFGSKLSSFPGVGPIYSIFSHLSMEFPASLNRW